MCIYKASDVITRFSINHFTRLVSRKGVITTRAGYFLEQHMDTKTCNRCNEEKTLDHFYLTQKRGKPYYQPFCRECHCIKENTPERKKQKAEWHQRNKERLYQKVLKKKADDPEAYKEKKKKEREKLKSDPEKWDANLAYWREWRKNNPKSRRKTWVKYRDKNIASIRSRNIAYMRERKKTDVGYKLRHILSAQMRYALRNGGTKSARTIELLGCSPDFLKAHLESQFQPGMTWDNYGIDGWHIDHIYPCSGFDLTDPYQQKLCFNYKNLQPMWAFDNKSKGGKIDSDKPDFILEYDKPKQSKARAKVYKTLGCKEG